MKPLYSIHHRKRQENLNFHLQKMRPNITFGCVMMPIIPDSKSLPITMSFSIRSSGFVNKIVIGAHPCSNIFDFPNRVKSS